MADQSLRIEDLLKGDKVDLEGDLYAKGSDMESMFEFEYMTVDDTVDEGRVELPGVDGGKPKTVDCIRVDFENLSVAFPSDHEVKIQKRDMIINIWQAEEDDGWYWDDSEDHGGFDRISPSGPFSSEVDALVDAGDAFSKSHVVFKVGSTPFHYFDDPDGPKYTAKGDSSAEANWRTVYGGPK